MPLKICTWNVHHFADPQLVARTVSELAKKYDLDLIFLQEIVYSSINQSVSPTKSVIVQALPAYSHAFAEHLFEWRGMKEGVATFSRLPIIKAQKISLGSRAMLTCSVEYKKQTINTRNVHLSPLNSASSILSNLSERKPLLEALQASSPLTIVAGDLNTPRHSKLFRQLSSQFMNTSLQPTWRGGVAGRYALLEDKLDYVFLGSDLGHINSTVDRIGPSDHFPMIVQLEIR